MPSGDFILLQAPGLWELDHTAAVLTGNSASDILTMHNTELSDKTRDVKQASLDCAIKHTAAATKGGARGDLSSDGQARDQRGGGWRFSGACNQPTGAWHPWSTVSQSRQGLKANSKVRVQRRVSMLLLSMPLFCVTVVTRERQPTGWLPRPNRTGLTASPVKHFGADQHHPHKLALQVKHPGERRSYTPEPQVQGTPPSK